MKPVAVAWLRQRCLVLLCLSAAPAVAVPPMVQVHRAEHPAAGQCLSILGSLPYPEGTSFPVNTLIEMVSCSCRPTSAAYLRYICGY